jgi:hypothetical protein
MVQQDHLLLLLNCVQMAAYPNQTSPVLLLKQPQVREHRLHLQLKYQEYLQLMAENHLKTAAHEIITTTSSIASFSFFKNTEFDWLLPNNYKLIGFLVFAKIKFRDPSSLCSHPFFNK